MVNFGILGVHGRVNAKIINKQITVLQDLSSWIKKVWFIRMRKWWTSYGFSLLNVI